MSVKTSLKLLSHRDRTVIKIVIAIQVFLSLLDLLGVILIGLVTALALRNTSNTPTSENGVMSVINQLPNSPTTLLAIAVLAGAVLLAKSFIGLLLTRKTFRFLANRQAVVAGNLAQRLLSRPLLELQSRSSQETTLALTNGVTALTLDTLGPAVVVAAEISLIVILFIGLLLLDPLVAVFSVVFFGLLVIMLHFAVGSWATKLGSKEMHVEIGSLATLQHALRAYREISVSGRRSFFVARFQTLRLAVAQVHADKFVLSQIGKYVFEVGLVLGGGLLVIFVFISRDTVAAIGIITVFLVATARLFPSLLRLQSALYTIRTSSGAGSITLELIHDLDHSLVVRPVTRLREDTLNRFTESVRAGFPGFVPNTVVSSVSLRYPGAKSPALDSVSLVINSGQSVAFVGSTGAGKSTLADVILGVLIPSSGNVLISGLEPQECITRWPGAIAYVPQDVAVLSGTVRDNVALGIPEDFVDDSLVWEALERSRLSGFLLESRHGIETVVGENGVQLSGGQRQRLGLARALYSRPKLLVLDEATSSLDAGTERAITQTLESLAGDTTLIIIAHRLATVRRCDQIIHLSEGQITGRGTFDEVRAQVPEFNRQAEILGL